MLSRVMASHQCSPVVTRLSHRLLRGGDAACGLAAVHAETRGARHRKNAAVMHTYSRVQRRRRVRSKPPTVVVSGMSPSMGSRSSPGDMSTASMDEVCEKRQPFARAAQHQSARRKSWVAVSSVLSGTPRRANNARRASDTFATRLVGCCSRHRRVLVLAF